MQRERLRRMTGTALRSLARLASNDAGGVAPLLAIALLPIMVGVGAAVDFSRASAAKTAMQAAVDSTALSIAKSVAQQTSPPDAQLTFNALFSRSDMQNLSVSSNIDRTGGGTSITIAASGTIRAAFMQIMGYSQLTVATKSTAFTATDTFGCVMALDKTASPAVSLGGSTSLNLSDCAVYSNSNAAPALTIGGSASLTAYAIGVVGGASVSSSDVNVTNGIEHIDAVPDPYQDVQVPSYAGCDDTNLKVKVDTTISPGVYCNGISVNAGATLTFNPGIYYIDRGTMSVNGGGAIIGTGVTLIFTSSSGTNWATANINANASVNLTAPVGGPTAGLVIFGDPKAPVGTAFSFEGGSTQVLGGAIYAPTGAISYSGGAATSGSCTQIIGDTVTFTGTSNVAINCSSYKTRPFGPTVIRIAN